MNLYGFTPGAVFDLKKSKSIPVLLSAAVVDETVELNGFVGKTTISGFISGVSNLMVGTLV